MPTERARERERGVIGRYKILLSCGSLNVRTFILSTGANQNRFRYDIYTGDTYVYISTRCGAWRFGTLTSEHAHWKAVVYIACFIT